MQEENKNIQKFCIHCGYPLMNMINTKCNINGVIYDFKEELPIALLEKTDDYVPAIGKIRKKTSLTLMDADDLVDIIREIKAIPETFTPKYPLEDREKLYGNSKEEGVECPTCHSKSVQPISGVERGASIIGLGIFSKKINKSYKCKHCGYTW